MQIERALRPYFTDPLSGQEQRNEAVNRLKANLMMCVDYQEGIPVNTLRPSPALLTEELQTLLNHMETSNQTSHSDMLVIRSQIETVLSKEFDQLSNSNVLHSQDRGVNTKVSDSDHRDGRIDGKEARINSSNLPIAVSLESLSTDQVRALLLVVLKCTIDEALAPTPLDGSVLMLFETETEFSENGIAMNGLNYKRFVQFKSKGIPSEILSMLDKNINTSNSSHGKAIRNNDNVAPAEKGIEKNTKSDSMTMSRVDSASLARNNTTSTEVKTTRPKSKDIPSKPTEDNTSKKIETITNIGNHKSVNKKVFCATNATIRVAVNCYCANVTKGIKEYGPIGEWDTKGVTDMSNLFQDKMSFNESIGNWNVSNVTNMAYMFYNAVCFNQPLGSWNVSNVTDMSRMFSQLTTFNQPLGSWNVSNVTNMSYMFSGATAFNQPLGSWNVSNVTNMSYMFEGARAFNQPLGSWNVSNVMSMSGMFGVTATFNQPLGSWNVSKVTDMTYMFCAATAFNQPLGSWNVSKVTDMRLMFQDASAFNQPLGSWNVSNVTNMSAMFSGARAFNQPLGSWNVSKVTDMTLMFCEAAAFNQPLGSWNVSKVTKMGSMFSGTTSFNSAKPRSLLLDSDN